MMGGTGVVKVLGLRIVHHGISRSDIQPVWASSWGGTREGSGQCWGLNGISDEDHHFLEDDRNGWGGRVRVGRAWQAMWEAAMVSWSGQREAAC